MVNKMKYIYLGKIVNTHGLKGEIRLLSDFKYKERVFKKDFNIYIGKDKVKETITSYRHHKIFDMICLEGYTNINEVLKYKGERVYILKSDLNLQKNEYLDEDLIGLEVYIENKVIGTIKRIDKNKAHDIILVKGTTKEYLIPYVKEFIKEIDLTNNKIIINDIKGLIE
jgi:16S rRNA processing protein RimM